MDERIFCLYGSSVLVKGAARSTLLNLDSNDYQLIPNEFYDIFTLHRAKDVDEIFVIYGEDSKETIVEYFAHFEENGFGQWGTKTDFHAFPELEASWDEPSFITNAIIEVKLSDLSILNQSIIQLENFGCKYLEIRIVGDVNSEGIQAVLSSFDNSRISGLNLVSKVFSGELNLPYINVIFQKFPRLLCWYMHSSISSGLTKISENRFLIVTEQKVEGNLCCGTVLPEYFSINIKTISESKNHNSCLNRKISIDSEGNIKNCPSMPTSFGNIKDTTLQEALNYPEFKKYWNLTKDQVAVCKDCEFRYICTDCRAYLEDPEDIFSKPLKCGYNPYTCEWEEWSTNPLKQKAIDYYRMRSIL